MASETMGRTLASYSTPIWLATGRPRYPDVTKILVIYNSHASATYSQSVCEYYAGERGIPLGNLWGFSFPNHGAYIPPTDHMTDFVIPLYNKITSGGYTHVIMGPQTPPQIQIPSGGAAVYWPSIYYLIKYIKVYAQWTSGARSQIIASNRYTYESPIVTRLPDAPAWMSSMYAEQRLRSVTAPTWYLPWIEAGIQWPDTLYFTGLKTFDPGTNIGCYLPHFDHLRFIDDTSALGVPVGRLGWTNAPGAVIFPETEADIIAMIDSVTAVMADRTAALDSAEVMCQFDHSGDGSGAAVYAQGNILKHVQDWSTASIKYSYVTSCAFFHPSFPKVGETFAWSSPPVGQAFDLLYGDNDNEDFSAAPWVNAYTPQVGAIHAGGASNGFQQTNHTFKNGGIGGMSHSAHWIGSTVSHHVPQFVIAMLCGLTLLESQLVIGAENQDTFPAGDPLFAPFGGTAVAKTAPTVLLPGEQPPPSPGTTEAPKSTAPNFWGSDEREKNFRWLGRGNPPRRRR